eukprot:CAMPEP_0204180324 /NCGR_PEP_ID=MMETSP0361-20130328/50917_1 /ASSEMBLY_ACC=CAM_ASM_000343 /TAXON_ID=268821 /ORGANISM="Scrippsiella Hangoei, Strain SHTV-5" /LENGTH=54 /DNA_ID=CAMNT_0051139721 /DNA_START=94 /DNA_END=255 /DNA_ORIENTATION=+
MYVSGARQARVPPNGLACAVRKQDRPKSMSLARGLDTINSTMTLLPFKSPCTRA